MLPMILERRIPMEPYSLSLFDNPAPRDAELEEKRRKGKLTLVRPLSYVVIDIETTGFDVARSAIIEIGLSTYAMGPFQVVSRPS